MNYNNQPGQFNQQAPMQMNQMQQQAPMQMQQVQLPDVTGKVLACNYVKQFNGKNGPVYVFQVLLEGQPAPVEINSTSQTGPKEAQPGNTITIENITQKGNYPPSGRLKRENGFGGGGFGKGGGKSNFLSIEQQLQKEKEIRKTGCNNLALEVIKLAGTKEKNPDTLLAEVIRLGDTLYSHITAPDAPQQTPQQPLAQVPPGMAGMQGDQNIGE